MNGKQYSSVVRYPASSEGQSRQVPSLSGLVLIQFSVVSYSHVLKEYRTARSSITPKSSWKKNKTHKQTQTHLKMPQKNMTN